MWLETVWVKLVRLELTRSAYLCLPSAGLNGICSEGFFAGVKEILPMRSIMFPGGKCPYEA